MLHETKDFGYNEIIFVKVACNTIYSTSITISNLFIFRYSARLNYDVSCNMDFHRYPVDQQVCNYYNSIYL